MVAFKDSTPTHVGPDELMARAKLVSRLLEVMDQIQQAAEQIKEGQYWEAYKTTNHAELICAEVAGDLHEIDLKKND
jgi:hypothetical protein